MCVYVCVCVCVHVVVYLCGCVFVWLCVSVVFQRALVDLTLCVRACDGVDESVVLDLIGIDGCWCVIGLRVYVCCVFVVSVGW